MRTHFFGIGLGNFEETFLRDGPTEKVRIRRSTSRGDKFIWVSRHYAKATHSSYNQNGAELGYVGLFLFVGILYCCIRTLLLVKSTDDDEERIRRALFAMVVAYAASSWMVDFCYRPTFFLMVAAVSAFHRHLLRQNSAAGEPVEQKPAVPSRPWLRLPPIRMPGIPLPGLAAPMPAGSVASQMSPASLGSSPVDPATALIRPHGATGRRVLAWHKPEFSLKEALLKKFIWTRLGLPDLLIMLVLTWATILYWQHLIKTM
jgi:hypothetical protein